METSFSLTFFRLWATEAREWVRMLLPVLGKKEWKRECDIKFCVKKQRILYYAYLSALFSSSIILQSIYHSINFFLLGTIYEFVLRRGVGPWREDLSKWDWSTLIIWYVLADSLYESYSWSLENTSILSVKRIEFVSLRIQGAYGFLSTFSTLNLSRSPRSNAGKISGGSTLGKGTHSFKLKIWFWLFTGILGKKFESLFLLGKTYYFLNN